MSREERVEAAARIMKEVATERDYQDRKWGGPTHDELHSRRDWVVFIVRQLGEASEDGINPRQFRMRMVKVAALAMAAIESQERKG